jgi:hypothetical protein
LKEMIRYSAISKTKYDSVFGDRSGCKATHGV